MFRTLRAILAQSRRLADVEASLKALLERDDARTRDMEALSADLDYLGEQIKSLRGRVTGSVRKERQQQAGDGDGGAVDVDAINRAIIAGTLGVRRGR